MGTHEVSDDWKNARGASPERASQHYALRPLPSNCAPGWKLNGARLLPGFCERPQEENEQTTGPCCAKGGVDDSPSMYGATRRPSSVGKSSEFVDTARTQRTAHRGRRESAKREKSVRSADTRNLPIYVLCCSGPEGRKHGEGVGGESKLGVGCACRTTCPSWPSSRLCRRDGRPCAAPS